MAGSSANMLAILIIGVLAIVAMDKQLDGQLLWVAIIAIAGLGGYEVYKQKPEPPTPT
jgi:hypothetical protein